MLLYDPDSGRWYEYNEQATTTSQPVSQNDWAYPSWMNRGQTTTQQPAVRALTSSQSAPSENPMHLAAGGKAEDNYAKLTRAQWEDYKRRFVPIEDELINSTSYANPEVLTKAIGQGKEAVNKTFDVSSEMQNRAIGRYGISQDPAQIALRRRMEGLNRSAAIVDAANRIRQRIADRNREITTGAAPSSGIQMQGGE